VVAGVGCTQPAGDDVTSSEHTATGAAAADCETGCKNDGDFALRLNGEGFTDLAGKAVAISAVHASLDDAVSPRTVLTGKVAADGRCSQGTADLTLEGKDPLRTSIDTGWMPSCGGGQEHCNEGLQVRANIALTAAVQGENLFTSALRTGAVVHAAWENPAYLELSLASLGAADSTLSVTHSLTPQVELYVDVGPFEQGFVFPATRLLQKIPGSRFEYSASASAPFVGWTLDGASVTVPAPSLQTKTTRLFSIDLA
jgi:hypothetical protein